MAIEIHMIRLWQLIDTHGYCFSTLRFNETTKEPTEEKIYLFHWLPYVLFVEAFLAFLPYLIYAGNTKAIISPILNEAQDMVIFTSGLFEGKAITNANE